jgi:hypothetical protein
VEKAIMDMCAECFHLTESTPLLQDPLLSDLGYLAKLEEAQAVSTAPMNALMKSTNSRETS